MKKSITTIMITAVISFAANAQKKNNKTEAFKVWGTCEQCKTRIEKALSNMGTYKATWVIATNMLTVSYDSTKLNKEKIQQKLSAIGHDNEAFQSDDATYKSLPLCCHYVRYTKLSGQIAPDTLQLRIERNQTKLFTITGVVLEETKKGKLLPLAGATVRCLHNGNTISTDSSGVFQLSSSVPSLLLVSYVGFTADTLTISSPDVIQVILKNASGAYLKEVIVQGRNPSTYVSSISTFNTLNIGSRELAKAA